MLAASFLVGPAVAEGNDTVADWTLAFYLDSDNDLDIWAEEDVEQMLSIASTESVNVILLWDKETDPATVHQVLDGELRELDECELHGVETNMGDPEVLREFVSFVTLNFASKNFLLVLWNHGDDSLGVCFDYHTGTEVPIDYLTHQEVVSVLSDFQVDVLLFAACVLAMVEVAYEYYASEIDVSYIVASEGYDPMPGFPWDAILTKLVEQSDMTPLALAMTLVDEHVDYYDVKHRGEEGPHLGSVGQSEGDPGTAWYYMSYEHVTFTVIDVSEMGDVVTDIGDMASAIISRMDEYASFVSQARADATLPWSQNGWERIIDLPRLVEGIYERGSGEVKSACEEVMASLSDAIAHHRTLNERSGYEGMGIFFPATLGMYEHCQVYYGQWPMPGWSEYYGQMLFADEIWLDFLNAYWTGVPSILSS